MVLEQAPDFSVFVEIKHDSSLGVQQLERYWTQLQLRPSQKKQLVLLARSKHSMRETKLAGHKYHLICWYQLAACLSELEFADTVCEYLVGEFLEFLSEKEMSMVKVESEYTRGVPALRNLANMIGIALAEAFPETHVRRTAGWNWIGYYFSGKSWVGLWYDDPLTVLVEKESPADPKPSRRLNLEEERFFSLKAGEQLELLIGFIANSANELEIDLNIEPTDEPDES